MPRPPSRPEHHPLEPKVERPHGPHSSTRILRGTLTLAARRLYPASATPPTSSRLGLASLPSCTTTQNPVLVRVACLPVADLAHPQARFLVSPNCRDLCEAPSTPLSRPTILFCCEPTYARRNISGDRPAVLTTAHQPAGCAALGDRSRVFGLLTMPGSSQSWPPILPMTRTPLPTTAIR